jgi:anti-anti-sigma factor
VALSGEIDLTNAAEIYTRLCKVVDRSRRMVVDLDAVTFIDARGIGACVVAQRHARARGCDMRFANPRGIVARVIEILDLDTLLVGDTHG